MPGIIAKWHKLLEAEILQRSSQVVSVVGDQAYIFGGELKPREPRDNDIHTVSLNTDATLTSKSATSEAPSPRVGSATATLNGKVYIFSGRGGIAMAPIEEQGTIWEFDPDASSWSRIIPSGIFPAARSYHAMASDGKDTIYVHAGCPEKGRLSDLWAFNLAQKKWVELAPAFDPPRGGTSIAFTTGKLYRMNGFDGNTEQGGSVDFYSPETHSWASHLYTPDGKSGPIPRSVSSVLPIYLRGRPFLITLFGERDPSSLGHQGAGKMLRDIWAFDIENKKWEEVSVQGSGVPLARGWFDADVLGTTTVIVHGGLGESNDRLGDVWKLEFV
ncbi:hypothetical protein N7478_012866 [Penicillium angulare]|uniref:uncharacterized protein n=1 Tax=Penicillium angulare TaxID=116970 RepID=UPI0025400D84|nr:uncharacterized protein N7478_012866 [Penicillium angulare]KAJ5256762.1 hypothetical protein N7478_012866 [Penicillium angulare]